MTFFSIFTRRSLLQKGVMSTKLFVCVVLLCVFTFRVPCANIRYDFHIKRCWVRLYLQLFVEGLMFYLRYLCLFAHSGVQQILCWVFFCLVFSLSCVLYVASFYGLSIFFIAPSYHTYFLLSVGRYICWWTINPRGYHPPSSQCFGTGMVY